MKKITLAAAFAELRAKSAMSMLVLANKCDKAETTVWKIEHGKSVRWETVHLFLTTAFNIRPKSKEYATFQSLWYEHRQEMAEAQAADFGTKKLSPAAVAAVRKFRKLVSEMDEKRIKRVMAAVTRNVNSQGLQR